MKKKVLFFVGGAIVLLLSIVALVIVLVVRPNMEREALFTKFPDRGVARINIELNGVSLDEIKGSFKEEKYEGNRVTIIGEDELSGENSIHNSRKEKARKNEQIVGDRDDIWEFSDVQVKGRGNATWVQEKKPYQIKFKDKVDLFGMGKARKWVLLANALDTTHLRIEAAFYLEKMLGMKSSFEGEFVELYFDGEYEGLYYLTHAVEIGKNTVDLKDPMGILVELDNLYGRVEEYYETGNGDILTVKDVVKTDNKVAAMEAFKDSYNQFEMAVAEGDYDKIRELIDTESFAKYYLLSEFTVNPDAYWTSFYMYKDGINDKIHAGPGWDFDLAFANKDWGNWMGEEFYSPTRTMIRKSEIMTREMYEELGLIRENEIDWHEWSLELSHIMFDLMKIPEFQEEVKSVFVDKMQGREEALLLLIEQQNSRIQDAVFANEKKWGIEGSEQEFSNMEQWIKERYNYFDEIYGGGALLSE